MLILLATSMAYMNSNNLLSQHYKDGSNIPSKNNGNFCLSKQASDLSDVYDTGSSNPISKKQGKNQSEEATPTSDRSDTSDSRYASSPDSSSNSNIDEPSPKVSASQIQKFFYDEPGTQYIPLPPHPLEQSPCHLIIGRKVDKKGKPYFCKIHPKFQNVNLDTVEHHCKYDRPEIHKKEILSRLSKSDESEAAEDASTA
jgi:hypothetical protein